MILGAMSVGATRSGANPDSNEPRVLLSEDTAYSNGNSSSSGTRSQTDSDTLAGLQVLPVNTSKPYTTPIDTKNKAAKLNVLLGANPIRLNIAAEATGKGLKINLDVNSVTTTPVEVTVPDVPAVDTSTITQDPTTPTDSTTTPTGSTDETGTDGPSGTGSGEQQTTVNPDSAQ